MKIKRTLTERDHRYLNSLGIHRHWWDKELPEFTNDPEALELVTKCLRESATMAADGVGLLFHGANGVGKSHLLMCSMKYLAIERKARVQVVNLSDLITLYKNAWSSASAEDEYKRMLGVQILAIEEIGKEFNTHKDVQGSLALNALDYTLRWRVQHRKPVWGTTNLKPSAIKDKYTQDIASLLKECSIPVNVRGADYRDTKLKAHKDKYT